MSWQRRPRWEFIKANLCAATRGAESAREYAGCFIAGICGARATKLIHNAAKRGGIEGLC